MSHIVPSFKEQPTRVHVSTTPGVINWLTKSIGLTLFWQSRVYYISDIWLIILTGAMQIEETLRNLNPCLYRFRVRFLTVILNPLSRLPDTM